MSTKHNNPCLIKAEDDEPIFVLRARDSLAPELVDDWGTMLAQAGGDEEKAAEAYRVADRMREWQRRKGSKLPD